MASDTPELAALLSRVELREARLLGQGIVDAAFTRDELLALLGSVGSTEPSSALDEFLARGLVVETPDGRFRTRMAETVRIISGLRQWLPWRTSAASPELIFDHRFLHQPRRRPRRVHGRAMVAEIASRLGTTAESAAGIVAPDHVSDFQLRSTDALVSALQTSKNKEFEPTGIVISAGTGSGKTLAFYMPALSWIAESVQRDPKKYVRALAIYPRNELLKDQLRTALGHVLRLKEQGLPGARPLRIGTWFGPTPTAPSWVTYDSSGWATVGSRHDPKGWICPFLPCPTCDSDLVWSKEDIGKQRERLTCGKCGLQVDSDVLCLTRNSATRNPPDVMFTSTESLNRQLASPDTHPAFGLTGEPGLRMVLLDEVHTYEGTSGAQNAYLLRRLQWRAWNKLVFAGLSATLLDASTFFSDLTGVSLERVTVIEPAAGDLEESSAEYQLALRHNPGSQTGPLSASIQVAMALGRSLDAPTNSGAFGGGTALDSGGLFGSRAFVFTDKLDVTNRLYWDLLDAEGWADENKRKGRVPTTLAHLRSRNQSRWDEPKREAVSDRADDAQHWWMAQHLGHDIENDEALGVGRTSSQDRGVGDHQLIVATATLEVGYDDDRVGAVLQHKAPRSPAQFIQRKGRAGRDIAMRPWTVVVLSDFGRDRLAFDAYHQLFDPELEAARLPLGNRYVQKMQAVYATLDWLARNVDLATPDRNTWRDLAGPAASLERKADQEAKRLARQEALAHLIKAVLDGGPERGKLTKYLQYALRLSDVDVEAVLWGPPRALMLAVLPTALRRLERQWAHEVPGNDDLALKTRTPLRDFVAGNLFEDLLASDVRLALPEEGKFKPAREEALPVLRVLREYLPGNVSRHFGIGSFGRRHWVEPVLEGATNVAAYGGRQIRTVEVDGATVRVYEPTRVELAHPDKEVLDSSATFAEWEVDFGPLGSGVERSLPEEWHALTRRLTFHLHADGGGVRVTRYLRAYTGSVRRSPGGETVVYGTFEDDEGADAALGTEFEADGLCLEVLASDLGPITPLERSLRLRDLVDQDQTLTERPFAQRAALLRALLLCIATAGDPLDLTATTNAGLSEALRNACLGLGLIADGDGAQSRDDESNDEQLRGLEGVLRQDPVIDALRTVVEQAAEPLRDEGWAAWQRKRVAVGVASLFLDAVSDLVPSLDPDAISLDLLSRGDSLEVWLCEQSPGGVGMLEAVHTVIVERPFALRQRLHEFAQPAGLELLDRRLTATFVTVSPELEDALASLRSAWDEGHAAVEATIDGLRSVVGGSDVAGAISRRIAGPATPQGAEAVVSELLERWRRSEESAGFAFDTNSMAAAWASDTSLDAAADLDGASISRRRSVFERLLWPRSLSLAGDNDRGFVFGDLPPGDRVHVRSLVPPPWSTVVCNDAQTAKDALAAEIGASGLVALRFADEGLARVCALALIVDPIDLGGLHVHPRVVGIHRVPEPYGDGSGGIDVVFAVEEFVS